MHYFNVVSTQGAERQQYSCIDIRGQAAQGISRAQAVWGLEGCRTWPGMWVVLGGGHMETS